MFLTRMARTCSLAAALGLAAASTAGAEDLSTGGLDQPGGTVSGTVKFDGRQARRRPIRMKTDAYCQKAHADKPALAKTFIFGENDTLQNVFVYVSKGLEGRDISAPEEKVVLDQTGCQYTPHVRPVMVGQTFEILNSDDTLHNVKASPSENDAFNEGMPVKGMTLEKKFRRPEMGIAVRCDVHPWMSSWVHVMEHPFYAVTGEKGTFEITGLPDGEYEVSVWHEFDRFSPREKTLSVTVENGEASGDLAFTYLPPGKK